MTSAKIKLPRKLVTGDEIPIPAKKRLSDIEKSANRRLIDAEKAAKKRLADEEKAAKKAQKDLDTALKKSANEQRKKETPGQAIKFLAVLLPESLISKYDGIPALLTASNINHEPVSSPIIENLIIFRRDLTYMALGNQFQMQGIVQSSEEKDLIIIMFPDEVIPKISNQILNSSDCMISYVQNLQSLFTGKNITLFFMEMDKYLKKQKRSNQQDFRNRILNDGDGDLPQINRRKNKNELPTVSQMELNSALVELQLVTQVNYRIIKDVPELGLYIIQFAKAVADAPYKSQKMQEGFDWYAIPDAAGSIKVDKDGNGSKSLWIDQLMQFNNAGIDTAQAIAAKYTSPKALLQAYKNCDTIDDALYLIQDIPVRLGIGPFAKTRKVGPALSKRMYRFFNCSSGDRSLSNSQDTS